MSTKEQYEEEDIYDVQPTNLISVGGIKNMFEAANKSASNEPMTRKAPPKVFKKPLPNDIRNDPSAPELPSKAISAKNDNSPAPDLPAKSSERTESFKKPTGNKLKNNIFMQKDQEPPTVPTKPKPKTTKPFVPLKPNAVKSISTSDSSEKMESTVHYGQNEVKTSPRATQHEIENALSHLKSVTKNSDGNNNKTNEGEKGNTVIRKKYPQKKSVHRTSTIKRKSYKRLADARKFLEIPLIKLNLGGKPPQKPEKVADFDLSKVIKEFEEQLSLLGESSGFEEDDIYEDIALPTRERTVSLIKPMSEDEECPEEEFYEDTANTMDTTPPPERPPLSPQHVSTDGHEPEEDYEELPERDDVIAYEDCEQVNGEESKPDVTDRVADVHREKPSIDKSPPNINQNVKEEKLSEKERKKREKEEKERQKREEKKLKEILKKFKITVADLKKICPTGKIKTESKGTKSDLAVTAGQMVKIIRMEKPNPSGRWLVQLPHDDSVGYVVSDNVEVETSNIRGTCTVRVNSMSVMESSFEEPRDENGEAEDLYEPM